VSTPKPEATAEAVAAAEEVTDKIEDLFHHSLTEQSLQLIRTTATAEFDRHFATLRKEIDWLQLNNDMLRGDQPLPLAELATLRAQVEQAHADTLAKLADATNEDRNGMAEMRALVESMRRDSERLDYLELLHHPCQPETEDEVSHMSVTICLPMGEVLVRDVSVRAAIDSAREQAPKNGGDKP
jgi:hypothetical protein